MEVVRPHGRTVTPDMLFKSTLRTKCVGARVNRPVSAERLVAKGFIKYTNICTNGEMRYLHSSKWSNMRFSDLGPGFDPPTGFFFFLFLLFFGLPSLPEIGAACKTLDRGVARRRGAGMQVARVAWLFESKTRFCPPGSNSSPCDGKWRICRREWLGRGH
jgi:hypothetical protein